MDNEGLVFEHQGINSHIIKHVPMRFQLLLG